MRRKVYSAFIFCCLTLTCFSQKEKNSLNTIVNNRGFSTTYIIDGVRVQFGANNMPVKYWIYFKDKKNSAYTKSDPSFYLSPEALERRARYNIGISETDLPVSENYISELQRLGINIDVTSRWLNAVSASMTNTQINHLMQLGFVRQISPVKKYRLIDDNTQPLNNNAFFKSAQNSEIEGVFGYASAQIEQINLDTLIDLGYRGGDMVMAVFDAGFFGMDTATLFQSFWDKGQILGFHNFPDNSDEVFNIYSGYHGSWVSSVIGGEISDVFSGSAPDIKLFLFRTEIADSEYIVEEDHWLEAAEVADIIGVDIINSSLGYTTFDDSLTNHTYAELDGNTSIITWAADMAASKGILVCNSAGNEGGNAWHYISMPSDGDSVFCIGGVDTAGFHAGFSGYGPTSDGRLKPNVVALAVGSAVLDPGGNIINLSGTSFSSPLIAGACASLWGAFPYRTNMEIMEAVQQSASMYLNPNDPMGYGIPDFGLAFEILKAQEPEDTVIIIDTTTVDIEVMPNPASDHFTVFMLSHLNQNVELQIHDMQGELKYSENIYLTENNTSSVNILLNNSYSSGIYSISLISKQDKQSKLIFVR